MTPEMNQTSNPSRKLTINERLDICEKMYGFRVYGPYPDTLDILKVPEYSPRVVTQCDMPVSMSKRREQYKIFSPAQRIAVKKVILQVREEEIIAQERSTFENVSSDSTPGIDIEDAPDFKIFNRVKEGFVYASTFLNKIKNLPVEIINKMMQGLQMVGNQINKTVEFAVEVLIEKAITGVKNKIKDTVPKIIDDLLEILGVCIITMIGGKTAGAVSLFVMVTKWYGKKFAFADGIHCQNEEHNPIWFALVGIGAIVCKILGADVDFRWLLSTAATLSLASRAGNFLADLTGFVSDFLPVCIQEWIPLALQKRRGSEEHYELIAKLYEYESTRKIIESTEFMAAYKRLGHISKGLSGPLRIQCTNALVKCAPYFAKCKDKRGATQSRLPAAWLHLYGHSGIGKSALMNDIITELVHCGKFPEMFDQDMDVNDLKFSRAQGDVFWSGYKCQPVVIYDDLWQMTDDQITTTHASEFFNTVSCEMYPLNMAAVDNADIGNKGTLFCSPFVISTGNVSFPNNVKVADYNALMRRRLRLVKVIIDKDCKNDLGGIDPCKVMNKFGNAYNNDISLINAYKPHLRFKIFKEYIDNNERKNIPVSTDLTFAEFMKDFISACEAWFQTSRDIKKRQILFGPKGLLSKTVTNQVKDEEYHECNDSIDSVADLFDVVSEEPLSIFNSEEEEKDNSIKDSFPALEGCICLPDTPCRYCEKFKLCCSALTGLYTDIKYAESRIEISIVDKCVSGECDHCTGALRDTKSTNVYYEFMDNCLTENGVKLWNHFFDKGNASKVPCLYCSARAIVKGEFPKDVDKINVVVQKMSLGKLPVKPIPLSTLKHEFELDFKLSQMSCKEEDKEANTWISVLKTVAKALAIVGGALVAGKALYNIYENLPDYANSASEFVRPLTSQLSNEEQSYNPLTGQRTKPLTKLNSMSTPSGVESQSADPLVGKRGNPLNKLISLEVPKPHVVTQADLCDIVGVAANRSIFFLQIHYGGSIASAGAVALNDRKLIVLSHYFKVIRANKLDFTLVLRSPLSSELKEYKFDCKLGDVKKIDNDPGHELYDDLAIINLPSSLPGVRDNTNLWIDDPTKVVTKGAYLLGFSYMSESMKIPVLWRCPVEDPVYHSRAELLNDAVNNAYLSPDDYITSCWRYNCVGGSLITGNCGALLIFPNAGTQWFGGVHRAYISGVVRPGMYQYEAQAITKKDLEKLNVRVIVQAELSSVRLDKERPLVPLANEDLTLIGYLDKPVRLSERTQFVESPLHPINFPVGLPTPPFHPSVKEPAILTAKDPRHKMDRTPVSLALDKYKCPPKRYDPNTLEIAASWLQQDIEKLQPHNVFARVLTLDEAINGIPGVKYIESIDMTTSPGLPYINYRKESSGKKEFFEGDLANQSARVKDEYLAHKIRERIRISSSGTVVTDSLWCDSLKDEKLKKSKVEVSATRLFNVAPLDYLLVAKQYLGAFMKYMQDNQDISFTGIGITAESYDWTVLMNYFRDHDPEYTSHDGDWKWFDGTIGYEVYEKTIEITNMWYRRFDPKWKKEDDLIRTALLKEAFTPYECAVDLVFTKDFGMPSGWFGTAMYNCLVNYILGACFFIDRVCEGHAAADKSIWDLIKKKYYGDDNIYSYPKCISHLFNGERMSQYYAEHGQTYTPADKGNVWKNCKPHECSYLKRNTSVKIWDGQKIYLPRLEIISINEAINWTKRKSDPFELMEDQIRNVFDALVFYGKTKYNEYRDAILEAYRVYRKPVNIPTYQEQVYRLFGDGPAYAFPLRFRKYMLDYEGDVELHSSVESSGTSLTINTEQAATPVVVPRNITPVVKVAEEPITYKNIVNKWNVQPPITWGTTAADGDVLLARNVPMDLINNPQVLNAFRSNALSRLNAQVSVRISATRFHQGILLAGFVPGITKQMFNIKYNGNLTALLNIPNKQILYANAGEECIIDCPYFAKYNYIRHNEYGDETIRGSIGIFFVAVVSVLRNATGAANAVPVLLSSRFDAEFHFPVPVLQGFFDSFFKMADRSAAIITTTAQGVSTALEIGKDVLDLYTKMDRGPSAYMPIASRTNTGAYGCVDLPVCTDIMSLDSRGLAPSQSEHFCNYRDEMDLHYLFGIRNYLATLSWGTGLSTGDQLYSNLVTPSLRHTRHGSLLEYQPTSIDYLMLQFGRWRCDIEIGVHFSATAFASGTLRFSVVQEYFGDTLNLNETTGQTFASLDLSESKKDYTLVIPYNSNSNTKSVLFRPISAIVANARQEYGTGMWFIHVENPLVVGGDAPNTVEVVLTYCLKNVAVFDIPPVTWVNNLEIPVTEGLLAQENIEEEKLASVVLQVNTVSNVSRVELQSDVVVLSAGNSSSPSIVDNTVSISSLRDMARRFTVARRIVTSATESNNVTPFNALIESRELGVICNCYAGVRGGLYFKNTNAAPATCWYFIWDPSPTEYIDYVDPYILTGPGTSHSITSVQSGTFHDMLIPFTYNYNFVSTRSSIGNNVGSASAQLDFNTGALIPFQGTPTFAATPICYSVAGGDDFRCGGWMGPPRSTITYRN